MQLRSQHYIAVSRRMGKSGSWIMIHHLLPHLAPQFLAGLILMFPHAILHEASISFLGYGLPPEQPAGREHDLSLCGNMVDGSVSRNCSGVDGLAD